MKKCYIFGLILCIQCNSFTQEIPKTESSKRFLFGASIGISALNLSTTGFGTDHLISPSFPNFKFGYRLNHRSALFLNLPGSIYQEKYNGRERDRGFEGIIPCFQYWLKEKIWISGGLGLTFDAPAFYDIKDETERKFYFGPSILTGIGYEIWRKRRFSLDAQVRIHYGSSNLSDATRTGFATNFLIGFNWL